MKQKIKQTLEFSNAELVYYIDDFMKYKNIPNYEDLKGILCYMVSERVDVELNMILLNRMTEMGLAFPSDISSDDIYEIISDLVDDYLSEGIDSDDIIKELENRIGWEYSELNERVREQLQSNIDWLKEVKRDDAIDKILR